MAFQNIHSTHQFDSSFLWLRCKFLWGLAIPSKVKNFIWQAFHELLPTKTNLSMRGILDNNMCSHCKSQPETLVHALLLCPPVKEVWSSSPIWPSLLNFRGTHFDNLSLRLFKSHSNSAFEIFCYVAWLLWFDHVHNGHVRDLQNVVSIARCAVLEFQKLAVCLEVALLDPPASVVSAL